MSSHQDFIISVRVNVSPALYACQFSYDSSVMVLRKVVILWFAIAFFLNRCHGEGQASLQRWRGILLLNMSVGELVDRYVGRYVGKSVSPKTAIYNWRTRLKQIGFKLRTLITIRRWSLSLGRLVMSRPFSTLFSTGRGGLVLRKTSVPLIVSPWLYKACKYNYGFSLWHG